MAMGLGTQKVLGMGDLVRFFRRNMRGTSWKILLAILKVSSYLWIYHPAEILVQQKNSITSSMLLQARSLSQQKGKEHAPTTRPRVSVRTRTAEPDSCSVAEDSTRCCSPVRVLDPNATRTRP